MGEVATIRVKHPDGFMTINAEDFDPTVHEPFEIVLGDQIAAEGTGDHQVTTVDIIGTVSTARKLVAFAQASLTEGAEPTPKGAKRGKH